MDPDPLVSQRYRFGDSDPDPHPNVTDPQHWGQGLKQFCDVFFQNSNIFVRIISSDPNIEIKGTYVSADTDSRKSL